MSNLDNNTLVDDQHGIVDKLVKSDYFFVQPWFMGASVAVLLLTIVLTVVYTMLSNRQKRKNSREAILNLTEDQTIVESKCSSRKPCLLVTTCVILIVLIIIFHFVASHMRSTNQCFSEIVTRTWNCTVLVVTQPWFIGIVFGVLLVTAIFFKVHWILEEKPKGSKNKRRVSRGAPKQSVFSQPWFVAFLCAVVLIIILSVALFYLLVQKQGEEFWDTASRFFLIEPWFFGIVVGVVLVTLIIFSIFRILRGSGENYTVDQNDQLQDRDIVVESQGFDEYPSKNTTVVQTSANPVHNQVDSKPVSLPITQQEQKQEQPQSPQQKQINNLDNDQHIKSSAGVQSVMPSLSLQLNDGQFYDEKQFHDEDDSMAEYGLGENDQFNDEGSFIGLYNRDRIQNYMAHFNKNQLNNS